MIESEKLKNRDIKVICFDFFDTLVHRNCHPETILMSWARNMSIKLENNINYLKLYELRKQVEYQLKNEKKIEEPTYIQLQKKIFFELKKIFDFKLEEKSYIELAYLLEVEIEKKAISVDKKMLNIAIDGKKTGKKIVIISDFYMPKIFFEEILSYNKLDTIFDEIYVSSEYNARKSTGNLYYKVLEQLKYETNQILMIGDNRQSDYNIPLKIGFNAEIREYISPYKFYSNVEKTLSKELENEKNKVFTSWIPGLILFIDKLYSSAIKNGCKKLLFCSREGQNIKRLFDIYQKAMYESNQVQTDYLYVSRRSTLLPSLHNIESEKYERIFRQYNEISLRDFLFSIGFSKEEILKIKSITNINIEQMITSNSKVLKQLFKCNFFVERYNEKRKKQREYLIDYIKTINNGNLEEIHIVDIGWKGTIQDNIYYTLDEKTKVIGYYYGIFNCKETIKNKKYGLMFQEKNNLKSENYEIYAYNHIELERVFAADHGQVISYKKTNEQIMPVLSEEPADLEIYKYVENWQKDMNYSFETIIEIIKASKSTPNTLQKFWAKKHLFYQCVILPRQRKIYLDFRRKVKENFGNVSGNKIKNDTSNLGDLYLKRKYLYVEYSYRVLDKYHLNILEPIAAVYCRMVYIYKLKELL